MNIISEKYERIANKLIFENEELNFLASVKILYVSSDKERKSNGKVVFGSCEKVPNKYRFLIPYDFIIRVYAPNISYFDDKQIEILLHHELLHIHIEEGKDGEMKCSCNPHDIEDFKSIIGKYGVDWADPNSLFDEETA